MLFDQERRAGRHSQGQSLGPDVAAEHGIRALWLSVRHHVAGIPDRGKLQLGVGLCVACYLACNTAADVSENLEACKYVEAVEDTVVFSPHVFNP